MKELEQKRLVILHACSGGSFGYDGGDITNAPNEIFLENLILEEEKREIKLICKTKKGDIRKGSIRSKNLELLREIKSEMQEEGLMGKLMSEAFYIKIRINREFLKEK